MSNKQEGLHNSGNMLSEGAEERREEDASGATWTDRDSLRLKGFPRELVQTHVAELFVSYFNLLMTARVAPTSYTPQRILAILVACPQDSQLIGMLIKADQAQLSLRAKVRSLEEEVETEKVTLQIRRDRQSAAQFAARMRINRLNYKEDF